VDILNNRFLHDYLLDFKEKKVALCFENFIIFKKDNELKNLLPSFMLPHKIIILDDLPINKNGKIDRNILINFL
jgi:D-alanine--poly(phosphoribitol) ligase subunit 1